MNIKIDNLDINYRVEGQGDNVVLIHGWGCNINTVKCISDLLKERYKVFSLDLPGFGKSSTLKEAWGVKEYSEFVEKFMKKLNIKSPIVIGHSIGGRIAIWLGAHMDLNKIVLIDSAGIKKELTKKVKVKIYIYKMIKKVLLSLPIIKAYSKKIINKLKSNIGSIDYKNASPIMRESLVKIVNEDLRYLMKDIKVSTLLIWGEHDQDTPLSDAKIMEEKIKNSGLAIIKSAGHYSFLDNYPQFSAVLSSFLK